LNSKYDYLPRYNQELKDKISDEHREISLIEKQLNLKTQQQLESELPIIPKDRLQWEYHCRPYIKGNLNRLKYLPPLREVFEDQHPWQFWLWARQWGRYLSLFRFPLMYGLQ